ncbi:uncharacterized protein [Argopecten irradians]|uniref:uncharacterized protein n=1 Tax=Argopecten irradians TaxID=31199 RepID=UPI0037108B85
MWVSGTTTTQQQQQLHQQQQQYLYQQQHQLQQQQFQQQQQQHQQEQQHQQQQQHQQHQQQQTHEIPQQHQQQFSQLQTQQESSTEQLFNGFTKEQLLGKIRHLAFSRACKVLCRIMFKEEEIMGHSVTGLGGKPGLDKERLEALYVDNDLLTDVCEDDLQLIWRSSGCIMPVLHGEIQLAGSQEICSYITGDYIDCVSGMLMIGEDFCPKTTIASRVKQYQALISPFLSGVDMESCFINYDPSEVSFFLSFKVYAEWNSELLDTTSLPFVSFAKEFESVGEALMRSALQGKYQPYSLRLNNLNVAERRKREITNISEYFAEALIFTNADMSASTVKTAIIEALLSNSFSPLLNQAVLQGVAKQDTGYGDICYQQTDDTLKYQVFRECFYGYEQAVELQGVLSIYNTIPSVAALLANISAENCRLLSIGWSCFNTSLHAVSNGNQCSKDSASETISYYATAIGINEMDLNAALHHCAELYDSGETGISENGDRFATWILAECLPSLDWTDPGLLNAILYGQAVEDNACRIGHHIFECGQHIARNNKFAPYFHFNIEDVMKTLVQKAAWFDSIMPGISLCFIQDLNCSNIDSVILNLNNTCPSVNYLNTTDSTLYCSHLRATLLCAKVAFNWSPFPPEAFNDIVMFNTIKGNEAIFRGVFGGNSVSSCNVLDGDGEMIYWHLNGSVIPDKNFIQPGNCTSDNIEYLGEYICHESTPIYHGPLLPDDACGAVLAKKECIDRNMYSWAGKVCDNVWDVFGNRVEEMLGKNTSLDYCSKSFEITFAVMVPPNADIQTIVLSEVGALLNDLDFDDFEVLSITENKRRKRQTDERVLYLVVIKVSVGIGVTAEMIDEKLKKRHCHLRATLLCAKVAFNWSPFPPEAFNDIVMFNTIKGNEAIFRGVFGGNSVSSCNVLDGDGEMIYWHLNGSVIPDKNFIQPGNCTSDNIEYLGEYICHESTPIYHGPLLPDDACGAVLAKKECIDRNMYSWAGKVCDNVWDVFGNRVEEMLGKNTSLDYCK